MSDITVHIDETLDAATIYALQKDITSMRGVNQININDHRPHLMVVNYDHEMMNSTELLNEFADHGLHAELIGL